MRVALSLSGKRGYSAGREGLGKKLDLTIVQNHLKKHLIQKYNTDIFIHSWDQNEHDYLKKIFKPKCIKTENQKYFGLTLSDLERSKNDEFGLGAEFRSFSKMTSLMSSLDLIVDHEEKNNFKYDFIISLRLDAVFLKDLKLQKLNKNKIYVQPKVYHNHKVNLNFNKNSHHSSFILVLNSNHLIKPNYFDLYRFDFNDKENNFQKVRPIYNPEPIEQLIFKDSIIEPSLPLKLTNLMRRVYFDKETVSVNGKSKELIWLTKKDLDYNKYIYKTLYEKETKMNYFVLIRYASVILKRKAYSIYSEFYVIKNNLKKGIKKLLPNNIFCLLSKIKKSLLSNN